MLTEVCTSCKGSGWITSMRDQEKWDRHQRELDDLMMDVEVWSDLKKFERYNWLQMNWPVVGNNCFRCKGKGYVLTNDGKELEKLRESIEGLTEAIGVRSGKVI